MRPGRLPPGHAAKDHTSLSIDHAFRSLSQSDDLLRSIPCSHDWRAEQRCTLNLWKSFQPGSEAKDQFTRIDGRGDRITAHALRWPTNIKRRLNIARHAPETNLLFCLSVI